MTKNRWYNCVPTGINKCKIMNWKERSKSRAGWEESIQEVKVCIGLYCHHRRGIVNVVYVQIVQNKPNREVVCLASLLS
jgi:hypothetical protein